MMKKSPVISYMQTIDGHVKDPFDTTIFYNTRIKGTVKKSKSDRRVR
jgi:hypothetical protein